MNKEMLKSVASRLLPLVIFTPLIFYMTYAQSGSLLISFGVIVFVLIIWDRLFGDGLRKRMKYVQVLLNEKFPEATEDPVLNSSNWKRGTGLTDEVNQPMWVKADETGIAVLYFCVANTKPFIIPWDRVSQVKLFEKSEESKKELWARLFVTGIGMHILVPWNEQFNDFVPDRVALTSNQDGREAA